jgi:hypothetical protein
MYARDAFGPQPLVATCGLLAVLAAGCGRNPDRTTQADNRPGVENKPLSMSSQMSSQERKPIDLTGCLQKLSGSYLILDINRGTPGTHATDKQGDDSAIAARERSNVRQAYHLSAGDKNRLEKLVGKQVKVSGTVTESADQIARDERRGNDLVMVGTSGVQDSEAERARIKPGDLARVDVASIQQVGEGCGEGR